MAFPSQLQIIQITLGLGYMDGRTFMQKLPAHTEVLKEMPRKSGQLNGEYPAILAFEGGVKGYNIKETPCRKAPAFRAESFK